MVLIQEPNTKIGIPIPLPNLDILSPPLTVKQAPTLRLETLYNTYGPLAIVVWVRAAGTSPPGGFETYDLVSYALTG